MCMMYECCASIETFHMNRVVSVQEVEVGVCFNLLYI